LHQFSDLDFHALHLTFGRHRLFQLNDQDSTDALGS